MRDERRKKRGGSERRCLRAEIRTAMLPYAITAAMLSVLNSRITRAKQACLRTAILSGYAFMTSSMNCRGKGGVGVSNWCGWG